MVDSFQVIISCELGCFYGFNCQIFTILFTFARDIQSINVFGRLIQVPILVIVIDAGIEHITSILLDAIIHDTLYLLHGLRRTSDVSISAHVFAVETADHFDRRRSPKVTVMLSKRVMIGRHLDSTSVSLCLWSIVILAHSGFKILLRP